MTPQQFRKIALSLPDVMESEHMGHPDFRVGGKIVASLGSPSDEWGMIKLQLEQQEAFCDGNPDAFKPCNGAWGRQGYTNVKLAMVKTSVVRSALQFAIEHRVNSQSQKEKRVGRTEVVRQKKENKPPRKPSAKSNEFDDSEAVTSLLQKLDHPMKGAIERVRKAILKSDRRITEGIKWNAPSFYCHGWFATFHLKAKEGIVLVLHHGAKVRKESSLKNTIRDPAKLLTWASADRATIIFHSDSDSKAKQPALKSIVEQWVQFQIDTFQQ